MEVRAKKALGQHFLTDQSVAKRIVGALGGSAAEVCGTAKKQTAQAAGTRFWK